MEAGKAIYSILSGDSNVTTITALIYGNEARQGITIPCIVYNTISDTPLNTKSGFNALVSRVQVSCFAETYEAVNALAIVVRNSLADKALGTYGGVVVQNIKFESSQDFTESAGNDGVFHVSLDFMVHYNR
jgi:hypothetical protein